MGPQSWLLKAKHNGDVAQSQLHDQIAINSPNRVTFHIMARKTRRCETKNVKSSRELKAL